ncbi:MAG: autotransporter outer membrane beta-barrel domain-containing protein, partial [Akkermansia sp.]|nr:autotransporter outer membrane beta-barrel domain-containing protein [Akkermansia sp.]
NVQLNGYLYGKYYKNARIEAGELLVDMRDDFYRDRTKATTENGIAGAGMLDDALLYKNPQVTNPEGDLAAVMNALETGAIPQRAADKVAAAMSGASHAALGAAWSHDVDRQLRAIRNRTTQMGMADCVVNEDLPYFNAWINAEGDYAKMNADSTLAGYKLSSWGGTLGVDVDLTPRFTFGAAVTAMSGDFTADSAETAEGDLDRMYVTVFGRYSHRAWSHTLVATYGMADTSLKRTVDYGTGSYTAESDSDGSAFGVMYEVGYAAAINEDASTCLQPVLNLSYRHSSLDGSREKGGSDAALKLGDAEANVFTVALGARLQSTVGTSVYNRATLFEGRVLCKVDSGDRDVAANNAFTGIGHGRDAKSAEMGLFGVEVGAGITIPVAERGGAVFLDVTGEFRAKYTEVNGTVGYRFNF